MSPATTSEPTFAPGSWVRVKPLAEILATLDTNGLLADLPFMPEMASFCGRTFRVRSRLGKTCVDARPMEMREFASRDVLLLDGVRCGGEAHGGCERECLIFWRNAWLQPASGPDSPPSAHAEGACRPDLPITRPDGSYLCQSTALRGATRLISRGDRLSLLWWDWKQGNLSGPQVVAKSVGPNVRKLVRAIRGDWPRGGLKKTPTEALNLRAGEIVRVKPFSEIKKTLDREGKNRGLVFEPDMVPFCGRTFRVRRRVDRMISEPTGKMLTLTHTVTLEEIACTCPYTFGGCPRTELQLWREIWLSRT